MNLNNYYNLFYDGPYNTPSAGNFTASLNLPLNSSKLCGLNIIKGPLSLSSTISGLVNVGNYYYNSNQLVTYGVTGSNFVDFNNNYERDTSNITNGIIKDANNLNYFDSLTISNPNLTFTEGAPSYSNSFQLIATIYNVVGTTLQLSHLITNIFDSVSYTNPTNTISTVNKTTSTTGTRVWSTTSVGHEMDLPNNKLLNLTNNGSSYSTNVPLYDNSKSIVDTNGGYSNELLYTNGLYTTNPTFCQNYVSQGLDYSQMTNGNTINYRYATFAWKVSLQNISSANRITFTLSNTSMQLYQNPADNLLYFDSAFTNKLLLFYRIEDSNFVKTVNNVELGTYQISNTVSTPSGTYQNITSSVNGTTSWINAANITNISSQNYTVNTNALNGLINCSSINSTILYQVKIPYSLQPSSTTFIYCRVGIPLILSSSLSSSFSFSGISAQLQTN